MCFFSLDASNPVVVRLGATYPLPYFDTETFCEVSRDGVRYRSVRTHKGAPAARLVISYRDVGETFESRPGKLENFLTQRYCFYSVEKTDVCGAATSTTISARGHHRGAPDNRPDRRAPDTEPLLHYARLLDVAAWPPKRIAA